MTGTPLAKGKRFRGTKAPEQHPRHNRGKRKVDIASIQLGSAPDDPVFLPVVITTKPQPDFPHCLPGCVHELTIQQGGPGEERKSLCPKSPARVKLGYGDWVPVPSRLAQNCDSRGSAAAAALQEPQDSDEV